MTELIFLNLKAKPGDIDTNREYRDKYDRNSRGSLGYQTAEIPWKWSLTYGGGQRNFIAETAVRTMRRKPH